MSFARFFFVVFWVACGAGGSPVTALYDVTRAEHTFSAPFPSDLLRKADGTIDVPRFPQVDGLATPIVQGYARRLGTSVYGFGLNTGLYQKLSGPVEEALVARLSGRAPTTLDPVLLFPLSATSAADLVPLDARFLASANGDPYITDHLLLANPRPQNPLRGGTSYAFVVRTDTLRAKSGGGVARDPRFEAIWSERDGVTAGRLQIRALKETLARLGVAQDRVASATVFTTQDVDRQLAAIRARVEAALRDDHLELRTFREVSRIAYSAGVTSRNQKPAALLTVTFQDGSSETTELDPDPVYPTPFEVDGATFPYRVFEGRLRTLNLQGLAQKPYGTPGLGLINDAALDSGQIRFERSSDGSFVVTSTPEPEDMRVVIALPLDSARRIITRAPVVFFDHGTGGSAYSSVLASDGHYRSRELLDLWAKHRVILVSRDQPLFGKRFEEATDRGYNTFLVAYNIANMTAFRDMLRQAAIDNLLLWRFVKDKLNAFFTERAFSNDPVADTSKLLRFGHSLGSVTTHLGTAITGPSAFRSSLVSGSGGLLSLFFLDSGLLPRLAGDPQNLGILLMALNIDPATELTSSELIGGLAGVPRGPARAQIRRDHPVITLAQTILDPADPIAYARRLSLPVTFVRGTGDYQVPNSATDALSAALPNANVKRCDARGDYDPHACTFREDAGLAAIRAWLEEHAPLPR